MVSDYTFFMNRLPSCISGSACNLKVRIVLKQPSGGCILDGDVFEISAARGGDFKTIRTGCFDVGGFKAGLGNLSGGRGTAQKDALIRAVEELIGSSDDRGGDVSVAGKQPNSSDIDVVVDAAAAGAFKPVALNGCCSGEGIGGEAVGNLNTSPVDDGIANPVADGGVCRRRDQCRWPA